MDYEEIESYNEINRIMMKKYNNELSSNRYIKWGNMVAREKGYKKGYERGCIETVSKLVKKMLDINMDLLLIREITGLSEEEISNINFNNK